MSNNEFKKYNNEYIEGFLSDKEHFNGVLFLLREPNAPKQTEFWFKKSLENNSTQRSFTLYKNKFNIYLGYLEGNYKLSGSAYANIRPSDGENYTSKKYKELSNSNKYSKFLDILNCCDGKVRYVFTCNDIFKAICEMNNIDPNKTESSNIIYRKSNVRKRFVKINGITIFDIYHPSYTKYPMKANKI
jgi:hypothetical protein